MDVIKKLHETARRRIRRHLKNPDTKVARVRVKDGEFQYVVKHSPRQILRFLLKSNRLYLIKE